MHDVFLSFTRQAHFDVAEKVRDALRTAKIDLYIDEDLTVGRSISDELIQALGASRMMVVVYSAAYNRRWACQWELIHAYLAGAAEGDPSRRVLIVNPEAGEDHIVQYAAADLKFLRPSELAQLAPRVREKLKHCPGPMSGIRRLDPPRWLPTQVPGAVGFKGRFPDLWRVHNALSGVDKPLTVATWSGPAAMITGMAGIGKSSLAQAYAWLFGNAYQGGIFWTSIEGAGGLAAARARYDDQIRRVAALIGLPVQGEQPSRLAVLLGERLDTDGQAFLWVVVGLPDDFELSELAYFVLPARRVRTVFTARRAGTGSTVGQVALDGIQNDDGLAILHNARPVRDADRAAALSIVERLGGHPLALTIVAARIQGREGLLSYTDYARTLTAADAGANVLTAIGQSMGTLEDLARMTIVLAGLLDPAPIPVTLIGGVLTDLDPANLDRAESAGAALDRLRRGGFASHEDDTWRIHPLVVEAATRLGPPPVPSVRVATSAAAGLTDLLAPMQSDPERAALLVRHAQALSDSPELTDARLADGLRRLIADHHERIGDPARSADLWHRIASSNPHNAPDQVAAALAGVANGEYSRAVDRARMALDLRTDRDLTIAAQWALAAALDGLGRFDDAEDQWATLDRATWTPAPRQRIAFDVSRARAKIARGHFRAARTVLEPLAALPDDDAEIDQINGARIELARLNLMTSAEIDGRRLAERVVAYYRDRDAAGHARSMEAELVWAESAVALALFELRPDTSKWIKAEETLARLVATYPETSGKHSIFGLAARVQHGLVLVHLGKQSECREVLQPAVEEIREQLGARHPLYLRARYALGLAHFQLAENTQAAAVLGDTWRVQREVLGPSHPETLHSQMQYGIAMKFSDRQRASAILDDAWQRLPEEIGWKNDLAGILRVERLLRWVATPPILNGFQRLEQWRKKYLQ